MPYFWHEYLEGFADEDDGKVLTFRLNEEDKKMFPELKKRRTVKIAEDDQGFVYEVR